MCENCGCTQKAKIITCKEVKLLESVGHGPKYVPKNSHCRVISASKDCVRLLLVPTSTRGGETTRIGEPYALNFALENEGVLFERIGQ